MKILGKYYRVHYGMLAVLSLLTSLVYWWGWHVSEIDGMAFSRSGAIATSILAFFIVSNYSERLGEAQQAVNNAIEEGGRWTDASKATRIGAKKRAKLFINFTRNVVQYWYAILLFIASIIWGMGDLFYVLSHDGSITCGEMTIKLIYLRAR